MADQSLKALHTMLVDADAGYIEAANDATEPSIAALFRDMVDLHRRHHTELHSALIASGESVNDRESLMATVNKNVVWVRSALTGLNSAALASFVGGEERIVAEYEGAMEHAKGGAPAVVELLTRQEQALLGQIMKMRTLATAMKSIGR
jgi:uncharacterized protein (TIGR02284 family)